ncbi:unnamed protein product [Nezara viridula]|uniref:Amino acid transporter transmembrane domain-containing protein n=1 Tax=Nezara viridula TaxID=85310 RepID=A0A9P0E1M3_NEZVI|nr:unnamed protein product [Nezara viridula]
MDIRYFELIIFIPAVIISLIPDMKKMSVFSMLGNITLAASIGVVLPMENEMKRPGMLEGTFGVLNVTAFVCTIIYIFFGFVAYLKYGHKAADTITLNLPSNW